MSACGNEYKIINVSTALLEKEVSEISAGGVEVTRLRAEGLLALLMRVPAFIRGDSTVQKGKKFFY